MHRTNLARLIRGLKDLPESQLDLGRWETQRNGPCGAVRCVIGHAAARGWVLGLTWDANLQVPFGAGGYGFSAASYAFDIHLITAHKLFDAMYYTDTSKAAVLRRLEAFHEYGHTGLEDDLKLNGPWKD